MADAGLPGPAASAGADPAADEFRDIIRSRSGRRPPSALLPLSPVGSVSARGDRGLKGERGKGAGWLFPHDFLSFIFFPLLIQLYLAPHSFSSGGLLLFLLLLI